MVNSRDLAGNAKEEEEEEEEEEEDWQEAVHRCAKQNSQPNMCAVLMISGQKETEKNVQMGPIPTTRSQQISLGTHRS